MVLAEVKERLEYIIDSYKDRFLGTDLIVDAKITYQNENAEDCTEDDKKLAYISGEFFLRYPEMSEDEGLGFCMMIDCEKRNKISEKSFNIEATEFCENMDKFIKEISASPSPREYLKGEIAAAERESERLAAELNETVKKVERTLKIVMVVSVVIVAVGILLGILL